MGDQRLKVEVARCTCEPAVKQAEKKLKHIVSGGRLIQVALFSPYIAE